MFQVLFFLLAAYSHSAQLDINQATLAQVKELPVDSATAERIWEYVDAHGRLNSIYELAQIRGVTPAKLEELKPLILVTTRDWEDIKLNNIQRIQKRLASEEGPTASAVEEWQDLLLTPINVNKATVDDLLVLDNVSLVDAVSVVNFLEVGGRLGGRRDLASQVPGLSSYGYRNIRNYVAYEDVKGLGFGGNYRAGYEMDPDWFTEATVADFDAALAALKDTTNNWNQFYTPTEMDSFRSRLLAERGFRAGMRNQASIRHRLRLRLFDHFRAGGWVIQKLYEKRAVDAWKGFVSVQDVGPLKRAFAGDYRLTFGQGLLLDNNSELMARVYERPSGLFNDLSENPGFGFRGGAAEFGLSRFGMVGFYSRAKRDAILNPDGTVNFLLNSTPRYRTCRDNLTEDDYGGSLRLDLAGIAPTGTRVALNGFGVKYDRSFQPQAKYLDLPGDAEVLDDPNYTRLDTGRSRLFYGADFRTVIENVSLEAEYAQKPGFDAQGRRVYVPSGSTPMAYLVKARTQYDFLYVTALYRHYDVGYDNPYNRGFAEQLRFADTPLEKTYRVIDPAFTALQDYPMPKAEEGLFVDTRYQIGRQVTFTRVYLDIWRNLAWAANNYRFQGEVEYQPVYPVRLRFKQKIQSKELPKVTGATRSVTLESSLRPMVSLTNWDYFTGELRHGQVLLTPTMKYGDATDMAGDFVSVQWEHNFSDDFSSEFGVASWMTRGMSQWTFEDNGIDFLDGQGFKWYVALTDRVSDNLLVYLKFRHKLSDFPHTGLSNSNGVHFADGSEAVRDFVDRQDDFNVALQVDLLW